MVRRPQSKKILTSKQQKHAPVAKGLLRSEFLLKGGFQGSGRSSSLLGRNKGGSRGDNEGGEDGNALHGDLG